MRKIGRDILKKEEFLEEEKKERREF